MTKNAFANECCCVLCLLSMLAKQESSTPAAEAQEAEYDHAEREEEVRAVLGLDDEAREVLEAVDAVVHAGQLPQLLPVLERLGARVRELVLIVSLGAQETLEL